MGRAMNKRLTATLQYFGEAYDGATDPSNINGRRLAGSSFMKGFLRNASSDVIQLVSGDANDLGPVRQMIGIESISASVRPVTALVAPGPDVTSTTPTFPVERA